MAAPLFVWCSSELANPQIWGNLASYFAIHLLRARFQRAANGQSLLGHCLMPLLLLLLSLLLMIQCISRNWIYPSRMLDPIFSPLMSRILQTWRPRARYFSQNCGNSLHSIRERQFFAKSAHRDSLCSCSLETIFREINSSLPVNAGWNTCCAMGSHARRRIDTSIVSQSRVQSIQCQCK